MNDRHAHTQTDSDKETYRPIDRQADIQTDRHTYNRQADRQADRAAYNNTQRDRGAYIHS